MISRKEILDEFELYSSIDYKDNLSISEVWQHLGSGENRQFGFEKKCSRTNSDYEIKKQERIELFCITLKEFGNLKYAKQISKIGYYTAWHYINFLNSTAEERGLPPIFIKKEKWRRPNVKLNEREVSFIKYLITKYSTYKVAKMYNIHQATVNQIKQGFTWKNVKPIIQNDNPVKHINQFTKKYKL